MSELRKIKERFRYELKKLLPTRHIAWLGWADGTIVQPNRPNYVCCTTQDKQEIEAWNDGVPLVHGIQIDLYTDPDYPGLLRAKQPRIAFFSDYPYIAIRFHKENHAWPGPDTVAVELRQFMFLHPSVSGFNLTVRAGWIETTAGLVLFGPVTVDLSSHIPDNGARYALISIDPSGELVITDGSIKTIFTLVRGDIPSRPTGHTLICAVRLYIGQTSIKDQAKNPDLIDIRFANKPGDMYRSVYDTDGDGVVNGADEVAGVDEAGNNKYYGTNSSGAPGFHDLPSGSSGIGEAPLTGGPYGRQGADWVEVGSGGGVNPLGLILSYVAEHNSDPVDTIIEEGGFVLMIYFTSHNQNNWKSASSSYAIPSGKKLIFIQAVPGADIATDPNYRRGRLYSVTNNNEPVGNYQVMRSLYINWGGDLSNPSKAPEISGGQTIKLQVWNADNNKRAMGFAVILKLVDA